MSDPVDLSAATVRPLTPGDVPAFVEELWLPFVRAGARDEYDALAGDDGGEGTAELLAGAADHRRDRLDDEDATTLLAVLDDELAGFVGAERRDPPPTFERGPELRVTELFVRPECRRAGLGARLLRAAERWGRERDCEYAVVRVHEDNDAARSLYAARGYGSRYRELTRPLDAGGESPGGDDGDGA